MKQVFWNVSPKILTLFVGLLISAGAMAQMQVKGLVKDDLGEPLIGAKVAVKGGGTAVVTNFDGNFQLSVAKGATLVFSYMGFVTQELTASPNMVVTMVEDAKALEDVVVIGYGHAKKSDLTGSVSAMNPDDMSKGITNNATDMLVGKIAGVDVITSGGTPGDTTSGDKTGDNVSDDTVGSSGGGCDAGFGALALALAAPLFLRRRRS